MPLYRNPAGLNRLMCSAYDPRLLTEAEAKDQLKADIVAEGWSPSTAQQMMRELKAGLAPATVRQRYAHVRGSGRRWS